jgi:AraC-like DNA-binding protein
MMVLMQPKDGRERWQAQHCIARHSHSHAYAAIVLAGGYEECGSRGRFRVGPGDVLLHDAFDGHLDRIRCEGAQILNLVTTGWAPGFSVGEARDPDALARIAETDTAEARACLREQLREQPHAPGDWPDVLARDLLADPGCRLDAWADAHGLSAEAVSRGFGKVFGQTPAAFRAEARTRRAFALVAGTDAPLASIAASAGFADQAHMSRCMRALTGLPPGAWRRSNPFKTERARIA